MIAGGTFALPEVVAGGPGLLDPDPVTRLLP